MIEGVGNKNGDENTWQVQGIHISNILENIITFRCVMFYLIPSLVVKCQSVNLIV